MKSKNIFALVISLAFILFSVSSSFAQEEKIGQKDLPKVILNTFHKSYPNAAIKGVSIEKENDKIYYEIESIEGTHKKDFLYTKEGKVTEIEETLALNNIPGFVKSSVKKKYPNCIINKAERVTSNKSISYELVVEHGMQKNEIVLDSKGNIQKVKKIEKENEEKEDKENADNDND